LVPGAAAAKAASPASAEATDKAAAPVGVARRLARALGGFFLSFAIIFLLIGLWEAVPRLGLIDPFLLPPFSSVIRKTFLIMKSGEFFKHFNISIMRIVIGFFGALALAIPAGILMGWFRTLDEYLSPLVETCRNSSVLALYPIFILLFGIGELAKISIIVWGTVWVVLLNTISGVRNVDAALVKSARSMGVGDLPLLWRVLLPASLPSIITGVRLGATNAILVMIAAEMIGSNAGLGFMIFYFEARYAIPEMYGGIIFLAIMGLVVNEALRRAEIRLTSWQEKSVYLGI
jgi:NitT/TauT family transport system permease protein